MPSEAKAAVKEAEGGTSTVEWQGLTLELPAEVPTVVWFDVVEYEAAENPLVMLRLLRAFLGGEQFVQVRNTLPSEGDEDAVAELFDRIFEQYGGESGEASASSTSS